MTPWSVLYRPSEHPWQSQTAVRRFSQPDTPRPHFKVPLARAVLDDPAFSPDPRSHPHFSLANAASYKALPSSPPPRKTHRPLPSSPSAVSPPMPLTDASLPSSSPPLSSESDSLGSFSPSPSPTLSSATSQSTIQSHGSHSHVSLLPSFPNPVSPLSTKPSVILKPHSTPPASDGTNTLARDNTKAVASQNPRIPRKGRMKVLVRRLTSRHNLDRIDELDETDPSGVGYHHDGPYEAIGSNLAQPSLPQRYSDPTPRARDSIIHHSKQREFHPCALCPNQHQSTSRVPSPYDETELSLNLEPGQILQRDTIYSSHASCIVPAPNQFHPRPNSNAVVSRPDHSRSPSLPNVRTCPSDETLPLKFLDSFQNRPSPSPHIPRECYLRDNTLDVPSSLPLHHDRDTAPHVTRQIETAVFPPPRYESRSHSSSLPRSPQRTSKPSFNPTSRRTQSTKTIVPALLYHSPRHQSVPSLDGSNELDSTVTQSFSCIQNKPLEPPRVRHLPKRLVMPTPLQPQPPQPQHRSPPVEAAGQQDGYPDDYTLEGTHFEGQPDMYIQNRRILRKRSTAFPAKTPIPDHIPMSPDDAVLIMEDSPTKTANGVEGTKERTRRRRLSKRKNDV